MQTFLHFFESMTQINKLIWIFICLSIFLIVENVWPLIKRKDDKWLHAKPNLVFLLTVIIVNGLFGAATVGVFHWQAVHQIGLFYWVSFPAIVTLILSVMLLDLIAQYWVHYLLHKVKFMWKFHMVHHSDTLIDATTGTRIHPGDFAVRELFSLMTILIFGIPAAYYIFYRLLTVLFTYFSHANIQLPYMVEKYLQWIFITPNLHKFHHHFERPWTNTNFGNIFSLWDRMFGTLVNDDVQKIKYGLDVLDDSKANDMVYQMKLPFDNSIKTDY